MSQADWDRLQYYSRKVKFFEAMTDKDCPEVHPLTYFRIAQLQSSALFPSLRHLRYNLGEFSSVIPQIFLFLSPLLDSLELFNIRGLENTVVGSFLATLSSPMLSRIVLRAGEMSVDILKESIFRFKQLRSLELLDAIYMSDLSLLEVLGTLPSLENLKLRTVDPYPAKSPENSSSQTGGSKYFVALESLSVTGSFFLIQYLLGFIDSLCLKSIEVHTVIHRVYNEHEHEDILIPSMTIIASKWSKSLKNLFIGSRGVAHHNAISKCLILLMDLHEMQSFHLKGPGWRMVNMNDDDVRRLVMSWPKLRVLNLKQTIFSLSALKIIAENCPELHYMCIQLDISTFPPFDVSSKTRSHNLKFLIVAGVRPSDTTAQTSMECQLQVTQHLDLIFPYLRSLEIWDKTWSKLEYTRPDQVSPP